MNKIQESFLFSLLFLGMLVWKVRIFESVTLILSNTYLSIIRDHNLQEWLYLSYLITY